MGGGGQVPAASRGHCVATAFAVGMQCSTCKQWVSTQARLKRNRAKMRAVCVGVTIKGGCNDNEGGKTYTKERKHEKNIAKTCKGVV